MIPNISQQVIDTAQQVWNETIDKWGSMVELYSDQGVLITTIKAFYKRPKILGLFDRTQASFDQERYMVMVKASEVPPPYKFMFVRWDHEDHSVISVTKVALGETVFGYRILVKG